MKPLIKLDDIVVKYEAGKASETTALSNVSLEIFEGEYIVFLGPSGCGKSTLLYTIAGLEIPESGTVVVDGKEINSTSSEEKIEFYRRTIGMSDALLIPWDTNKYMDWAEGFVRELRLGDFYLLGHCLKG